MINAQMITGTNGMDACTFPTLTDGRVFDSEVSMPPRKAHVDLGDLSDTYILRSFAYKHRISLSTLFSATWAIVLGRYLGIDNVSFAVLTSAEEEHNGGVCRAELNHGYIVRDVLRKLDYTMSESFEAYRRSRVSVLNSASNSAVLYRAADGSPLSAASMEHVTTRNKFVAVFITEAEPKVSICLHYSTALIAENQAIYLTYSFSQALSELVRRPEAQLSQINLLSTPHLSQIWRWNEGFPHYSQALLHNLVDGQAATCPEAQAIAAHDGNLTYAKVKEYSDRLAHHLVALGVGPGAIVPFCFEKSAWVVVAQLAVSKAGGAMLAIDPKQPKLRTAEILSRVGATAMLTSRQNRWLWEDKIQNIFVLDASSIGELPLTQAPPPSSVSPSDMLYLVFTSGSTGKPKGCVIEHRNFCSAIKSQADSVEITSSTRLLQNTPYTFDVSMFEIYATLISGGCLCIPSDDEFKSGISAVIGQYRISSTFMTPSLSRLAEPTDVPTLKTLILGGEALTGAETKKWADHLRLVNGYGPTECSVAACMNMSIDSSTDPANVGRPLDCCTTWVVDANDHNQLVPVGAVGELLIQGPIVARGYFNDEEKTSEAFIRNPTFLHGNYLASYRLYKTGDLVRYNSDGTIHFVGRKDTQVKVRGQRIELSEIDHHLATDPAIRNAVVLLPKTGSCSGSLVAIIELAAYEAPSGEDQTSNDVVLLPPKFRSRARIIVDGIKERLAARVPIYMIPTFFAILHCTPVTSSGKTNRKLLTSWLENISADSFAEIAGIDSSKSVEHPSSSTERQIQEVWADVLRLPLSEVAANRSFISLGGDSITAIQANIRCRARGISVAMPHILQSTSLKEVARLAEVETIQETPTEVTLPITRKVPLQGYNLSKSGLSAKDTLESTVEDVFGTSPMQQDILLAQARNPQTYQIRQIFRGCLTNGCALDIDQLRKAWDILVECHAGLRTVIVHDAAEDGSPYQVVLTPEAARSCSWETSHLVYPQNSTATDEDVIEFLKSQERQVPRVGPQVALSVCTLPASLDGKLAPFFYCMIEINHALIDGGAYVTLLNNLAAAYDGILAKANGPCYRDVLDCIEAKPEAEVMTYWQEHLAGSQPCIVPTYGGQPSSAPEACVVNVDFQKGSELLAFCREHNFTVANVLQTAWSLVLRTLTSSDDVIFGYITSGRDIPVQDIDKLIGICSNLTVVRLQMDDKRTLRELAQSLQRQYFSSLEYQHLSLARLQSAMSMAGMPLFNTIMSLQHSIEDSILQDASIHFTHMGDSDPTDFDLAVSASIGEVTSIANMFSTAISAVITSAESTAQEVRLFSERDSCKIWEWNREEPLALEGLVHEQIHRVACRQPYAAAIASWDGDFTFGDIDDLSTRLSHHLIAAGIKPGMKVPFCYHKSAWATITAIAIMKAGAAFIGTSPLDPIPRLRSIIDDAEAKFVAVPSQHADIFKSFVDNVIVVDPAYIAALPVPSRPLPKVTSNDLAYLSFTSGSTGKPKGIKVQHGSLLTFCFSFSAKVDFGPHTRMLQFAAYAFDAHIAETITVLIAGGCFCVPTDEQRTKELAASISRMNINCTLLTPQVSKLVRPELVPSLEMIILGGEAANIECIRPWLGVARVHIAYGPTETTVCAAVSEPLTEGSDPLNLGYACGCRLWIVEADNPNRLVPIGAVGELLVEGRLVAEGYANRPDLTREAFIENPDFIACIMSPGDPARRFYRSGDLCRYNHDGSINFLGRKDAQVKVRGLRIEPGEIEQIIVNVLANEIINHVSVDAVELPKTGRALVAFLNMVGTEAEDLFPPLPPELSGRLAKIQNVLGEYLPSYMVPFLFVPIGYVPMGVTGKVDRKMLRKSLVELPYQQLAVYSFADEPKVAPTSLVGCKLQSLWAQVLKRELTSVGIHDNFFRLGGDSISAMHLAAAMRKEGLSLPMADIFSHPILKEMESFVQFVDESLAPGDVKPFSLLSDGTNIPQLVRVAATACGVLPDDVEDIYPCTPLQEGIVAITSRLPGAYVMRNAFELTKDIDLTRFQDAWQRTVDVNAIHRTRIVLTDALESVQVVLNPRPIQWHVVDSCIDNFLVEDKDIITAYGNPLSRYAIVKDSGKVYFVWSVHHATYDGWSLPHLLQMVQRVYHSETSSPMAGLQFNKFVQFLKAHNDEVAAAFWKNQLKGEEPASFPRLPNTTYQPRANALLKRNVKFSRRLDSPNITISTVIKAAWSLLLARYLDNADDVLFGQTLSGRSVPLAGIEEMQGPSIATIPVKVHINRETYVGEFLEAIQRQATEMIPYEQYGLRNIRAVSDAASVDIKNLLIVQIATNSDNTVELLGMKPLKNTQLDFDTYALVMETTVLEDDAGVLFHLAYDNHVLPEEHAIRLASHFEHIIQQLLAVPDVTLDTVNLFSEEDARQIYQWNQDAWEFESGCIHAEIERQATLTPDRIAIDSWDGLFTYAEVDNLASRLARCLSSEFGVGPEILVPMCFDKSAWTVIVMLANLKAGGGCVMLNPDHPVARLGDIIEQTASKVVLTAPQHRHLFDAMQEHIVTIDKDFIMSLPETYLSGVEVMPDNAAVVVFTSGSSGRPKGIVLEHRSIVTVSAQHCRSLGFCPGMRALQFSHFAFDMSNAEIFCVLMHGGTICVATEHDRVNNLARVVDQMTIDWLLLTPTVARLLNPVELPSLQTLVLIGEAVDQSCVDLWSPHVKLINSYGPAECTMWTSHAVSAPGIAPANIGRGFGARLWITEKDDSNTLAPIGCIGELLIEGPIVARGYLNQPEQAAAAFIESPSWLKRLGHVGETRVYKTGDLVKYLPDGKILFLGRKDSQVKLHGQRLELGEIERNLCTLDEVETAMVILPNAGPCKGRLTAVIAFREFELPLSESASITFVRKEHNSRVAKLLSQITSKVSEKLPPYMIPTLWAVLDSIPVTPSRKISRKKVEIHISSMSQESYLDLIQCLGTDSELPTTEMECKINEAWCNILKLTPGQVGITRSFIGLGGDSITAMQVVARCRDEHGISISIKDILQSKGVASISTQAKNISETASNFERLPAKTTANLEIFADDMLSDLGVTKENVEHVYPCSPIQEGILLSQARQPGSYLVRQVFRVQSNTNDPVDVKRLRTSWQSVVHRHSILRTIFVEQSSTTDDPHFYQVVLKNFSPNIKMLKYSAGDVVAFMDREAEIHYDTCLPVHQVIFCRSPMNEVFCLMELSHALIDGTSLALVQQDLIQTYQYGLLLGPGSLYYDYVEFLQSQSRQAGLDYWTSHLANISACHFPRLNFPEVEVKKPRKLTINLGLESMIHSFCKQQEVTMANVFQAAWSMVLREYTGTDEVAFGYLASGRDIPLKNISNTVGPIINTLICSIDMGGLTPQKMLKRLSQDYLNALLYQHTSLGEIQRAVGNSGLSLFNTIMSLQHVQSMASPQPVLVFEVLDEVDPTEYDIVMQITTGGPNVELTMTYWNKNMTDSQAKNVAASFRSAIAAILATPEVCIEEVNLFTEEDHLQILEWNAAPPPPAEEACLHWLIESQALQFPTDPAICSWDAELTYAEVSDLSDRLSHHLLSLGVGPEVMVPLCFEKSAWALVTMVSVLKAGGCTVMLNPDDPQQRLHNLVTSTEAKVMLTTARFASRFLDSGIFVVPVDHDFFYSLPMASGAASRSVKPTNKAMVMFTSGSTGTPKGIVVEHRSLCTVALRHAPRLGLGHGSRALQFAAYTWDVSTAETFFTLANGGCVCIPSEQERMNDIAGAINRTGASWCMVTPTVSSLLDPAEIPTMKSVVLCGETVPASEIEKWKQVDLYLVYGPAECSVATALSDRRSHPKIASCNIGYGIGARLWVTNPADHNILCPVGAIGELLIEGPIVARGYLKNQEKNADAFVTNPAWTKHVKAIFNETTRLYKTGDLVRYNADGSLSILGRKDTQVKISGQRTELSEIESQIRAVLSRKEIPLQAVVDVVNPAIRGEGGVLAAYLYNNCSADATASTEVSVLPLHDEFESCFRLLRTALSQALPSYMIPTIFIPISKMPYTTSFKINRKVLRNLGHGLSEEELAIYSLSTANEPAVASPLTKKEHLLAQLWAKTLGFDTSTRNIDSSDSFFRLGGNSLAAMKLVSHARAIDLTITVADIFKHQELCAMAQVLEDIYPATPLQEGLMAISTRQPGSYVLRDIFKLPATLDVGRFRAAWEKVSEVHPILRTRIITTALSTLQVVVKEGIEWYTSSSVDAYLFADNKVAFQYGRKLARYAILGDAESGYTFVWTAHHAIYDGFTRDKLYQQVRGLYNSWEAPPVTPYNRFIHHIAQKMDTTEVHNFWSTQFSGEFVHYPSLPSNSYQPQPTERIDYSMQFSRNTDSVITTATILRAAWAIVTGRYADSNDVVFGLTLSGRNAPVDRMDEVMGPTTTTLPVRITIYRSQTIMAFLNDVQSQSVEMIPYEHTGLQYIKEASPNARKAVDFQNLLVIQPAMQDDASTDGLGMERLPSEMANFDTYALVLECSMSQDSIGLQAQYDPNVLTTSHIQHMIRLLEHVIGQLATELRGKTVADIGLLSEYDSQQLAQWNSTLPMSVDSTIPTMIQKQVSIFPESIAVEGWDGSVSYRELDELSTNLAHFLACLGISPGSKLPIAFPKSIWTVVALLGALKAGAAVTLLNPDHPLSRLLHIFEDLEPAILLTDDAHVGYFESHVPRVFAVNRSTIDALPARDGPAPAEVKASDLAFVNFTSGTTGRPKGILIDHRNIVTSLMAYIRDIPYTPETRVLQYASYTFDVSISEILCALMSGATLCVPSEEERTNDIAGSIAKYRVNLADITPTVAMLFTPEQVPTLKTLTVGGEAMTRDVMNTWAGHVDLINAYGPAECSISTSWATNLAATDNNSNIGKGKACLLWVVEPDDHNKLAPIGAIGELLVEGPTVSLGYLNCDEETAKSFICNPAWTEGNQTTTERRMYCTGDLVQYAADGSIRYVGRKDTQVKIYGQRVEVDEIEYNITAASHRYSHVAVEVANIKARGDARALVAFLAEEGGKEDQASTDDESPLLSIPAELQMEYLTLQSQLHDTMPVFMVPSLFVPMKRLPIHNSGKLDRKKLRQIVRNLSLEQLSHYSLVSGEFDTAELTTLEKTLQPIWARNLKIGEDQINASSNFFRLGGDSVAAIKLAAEMRTAGRAITVMDIYASPTLAQMAQIIETSNVVEDESIIQPFSLVPSTEVASLLIEAATQCNVLEDLVEDIYPCTPLQEGLINLSTRRETPYIKRSVYRLPESLDIARYQSSWAALSTAHPILRTRIIHTDSGSLQVVLKEEISWQYGSSLHEYLERDKKISMTYGTPLVRYSIIRPTSEDCSPYFVWTAHHAIYDGWSESLLFSQVGRHYESGCLPHGAAFNTFINYLTNGVNENDSEFFWRTEFADEIPSSYPKLPSPAYEPTPQAIQETTIQLARNEESNTTLSAVIQAAWAAVLGRWSHSDDIVYGLTLAGRNVPVAGITSIVGPTITTVPVRVRLGRAMNRSIASFLDQISTQATQMMPFEQIGLQKIRRLGKSAVAGTDFRNLLVLQPILQDVDENLGLVPVEVENDGFDTFALVVECILGESQATIGMRYDETVISSTEVGWLMGHFTTAIEHMSKASTTETLNQLKIFSQEDQLQLRQWNATYPTFPDQCVHDMIKAMAHELPDREAVHAWDARLTYQQLEEMSTQLSYYLATLGVTSNTIVPLCFDKSAWAIVAMLAVMKSGGACVSLNPEHPIRRLQEIANDVGARIIISAPHHANRFDMFSQSVVPVGIGCSFPVTFTTPSDAIVSPGDPAFIIMTSGSTGKPKGVVLDHRALSASMRAHRPLLEMHGRRILQFASYTFDISIAEIFTTLSCGGTVCVPSEHDRMNNLVKFINEFNIDWVCLTPTVANLIQPADVPSIETLILSGEAPTKALLTSWADSVKLFNAYGPSECSIWSSIGKHVPTTTSATNIGYGAGTRLWIAEIDDCNRLAPLGCVGELLVDGPIVAQGYHQNPEKTANVFIEDPAWVRDFDGPHEGRRMYRTGDLARYSADGTIEYLGRKDSQSKLYGQRVEMGEIEYHVKKMRPRWREVAAEVIDLPNKKALAVFFDAGDSTKVSGNYEAPLCLTIAEQVELRILRDDLLAVLPSYMIPSIWLPVHELPKTTSGKLDRKALGAFLGGIPINEIEQFLLCNSTKRAPETDAEKTITALWAKVLGTPESTIGVDDTFFGLGGDSISAMRLVSIARARGFTLTVANIFRHPRLADLAVVTLNHNDSGGLDSTSQCPYTHNQGSLLESVVCAKTSVDIDNIQAVLPTTDLQSLALAGGLSEARWMLNYFFFESDNDVDLGRIKKAFQETVDHNEILRTIFILHDAKFLQAVLKKMDVELTIYETDEDLDIFTRNLFQSSKTHPLYLEEPLTRFFVIKNRKSGRHRIMMRISHAQYDGVSLPYIWNSYKNAYEGAAQGKMTGFSSFMSEYVSMQTDEGFGYWRNFLAGSFMTDIVYRTEPNVRKSSDSSMTITHKIPYASLNQQGLTFATMLKSAWAIVLSRISSHSDVVFGHTIAGRNLGAADVVGPCLNVIPVRVPLQSGWTLMDLMKFVQEQYLNSIPYENVGSREIIKRCTNWPEYVNYSSVVQHQNIDSEEDIVIDGQVYQPGWVGEDLDLVDISILSMPMGDEVEINVIFTPTVVPESLARDLLASLCDYLVQMSTNPHDIIPTSPIGHAIIPPEFSKPRDSLDELDEGARTPGSASDSSYNLPSPPMPFSPFSPPISSDRFMSSNASSITELSDTLSDDKQLVRAEGILEAAWRTILTYDSRTAPTMPIWTHTSSFFHVGGDIISATKLALVLREAGYAVTPEDIVFNPIFRDQVSWLAEKGAHLLKE
ncbi:acetyl-CoA synthetase-like protein [Thozetella sp. PMI_491]|nr:acetyl-CoA synthetase-like protein [Thozetella sp. PMI_491]